MPEPTGLNPLVLIVEDDPHSRRVAVLTLECAGFRCVAADCADAALAALGRERPSIVLMDLNLPGLDGLELTRWMKNDPSTREIPVMAVTAYALDDDADIARAAGCTSYIAKPYDPAALVEEVKRLVLGTPPHP